MINSLCIKKTTPKIGPKYQADILNCNDEISIHDIAYYVQDPNPNEKIPPVKQRIIENGKWLISTIISAKSNDELWVKWHASIFIYIANHFTKNIYKKYYKCKWLYKGHPVKSREIKNGYVKVTWPISLVKSKDIPPGILDQWKSSQENNHTKINIVNKKIKLFIKNNQVSYCPRLCGKRKRKQTEVFEAGAATAKWSSANHKKIVKY